MCNICRDSIFDKRWFLERHLVERHSGIQWKCLACTKIFARRNAPHAGCDNPKMVYFHSQSGLRDKAAEMKLQEYRNLMEKDMLMISPEGELIDTNGSVVDADIPGGEKKRKRVEEHPESGKKTAKAVTKESKSNQKQEKVMEKEDLEAKRQKLQEIMADLNSECGLSITLNTEDIDKPSCRKRKVEEKQRTSIIEEEPKRMVQTKESAKSTITYSSRTKSEKSTSQSCDSKSGSEAVSHRVREESVERLLATTTTRLTPSTKILNGSKVDVTLHALQQAQEEHCILNIGGMRFETSRTTLRNDPTCLFALMQLPSSLFRPSANNTYFFDRDPVHFKTILAYLRNTCQLEKKMLPGDAKYLYELAIEARFYRLFGLVTLVEERLRDLCMCKLVKE